MRYLSVCSGIEAATVAWHPLGWTPVAFSEIEPFPSAVLAHHYPNVPNYGDMTKFEEWPIEPRTVDLLVGGTPCQSFSVAGLRKGISDPRGGLMLTYLEIARRFRPRWIVWENVPGVLSSGGGRDFGSLLGGLEELGYGWAYRVLDAQWVRTHGHPRAVPQRRRRVFVVGCLGDPARAAQVLFERESVQRDYSPRGTTRQGVAADAEAGAGAGCWWDGSDCAGTLTKQNANGAQRMPDKDNFGAVLQPTWPAEVAPTLNQSARGTGAPGYSNQELFAQGGGCLVPQPVPYDLFQITAPVNRQNRKPGDPCHTLARDNAAHAAVAFSSNMSEPDCQTDGTTPTVKVGSGLGIPSPPAVAFNDTAATLKGGSGSRGYPDPSDGNGHGIVGSPMTVRRLTPRECERLQGFPDDYTAIPWRGKPADQCPDGPRYKALGNSMACNCMAWIGERIAAVDSRHDL